MNRTAGRLLRIRAPPASVRALHAASPASVSADAAAAAAAAAEARAYAVKHGFDAASLHEQPVVWGDLDSFQHVNNVRYVRYFESGRIRWMAALADAVGGPDRARAMLQGKGVSLILKSIDVQFRRPVTYPDTLLVAHKVHNLQPTQLNLASIIYSYAQRRVVTESDCVCVWYDYDKLAKTDVPADLLAALHK